MFASQLSFSYSMHFFLNVFYKNSAAVIKIESTLENIFTKDDFYKAGTFVLFFDRNLFFILVFSKFVVKLHYNISNGIKFYDNKTACAICDDDLAEYVEQFKNSPGWSLGAVDNVGEDNSKSGYFTIFNSKKNACL